MFKDKENLTPLSELLLLFAARDANIEKVINNKLYHLLIDNEYKLINWVNSDLVFVKKDFTL